MKITIVDSDARVPSSHPDSYRTLSYGEEGDSNTSDDWDYLFCTIKNHIDYLKNRTEDNLGIQISIAATINKLEMLLKKYDGFVVMAENSRHDI